MQNSFEIERATYHNHCIRTKCKVTEEEPKAIPIPLHISIPQNSATVMPIHVCYSDHWTHVDRQYHILGRGLKWSLPPSVLCKDRPTKR